MLEHSESRRGFLGDVFNPITQNLKPRTQKRKVAGYGLQAARIMRYELFYLVAGSKESGLSKIKEEVKKIVTEEGGAFEEKETTEKRRLAYKIKHEAFGFYSALRFNLEDKDRFRAINKRINLYPEVLRFIISRADELPELKSREERIAASEQAVRKERQAEIKKIVPETKKESKPAMKEDIDKKLEEILNI